MLVKSACALAVILACIGTLLGIGGYIAPISVRLWGDGTRAWYVQSVNGGLFVIRHRLDKASPDASIDTELVSPSTINAEERATMGTLTEPETLWMRPKSGGQSACVGIGWSHLHHWRPWVASTHAPRMTIQRSNGAWVTTVARISIWGIAAWVLVVPGVLAALLLGIRRYLARSRDPGLCRSCGYDLRATPDRCPECGALPTVNKT